MTRMNVLNVAGLALNLLGVLGLAFFAYRGILSTNIWELPLLRRLVGRGSWGAIIAGYLLQLLGQFCG